MNLRGSGSLEPFFVAEKGREAVALLGNNAIGAIGASHPVAIDVLFWGSLTPPTSMPCFFRIDSGHSSTHIYAPKL